MRYLHFSLPYQLSTEEDIHAKFENGILKLSVPKVDAPKVEENKYISIEG